MQENDESNHEFDHHNIFNFFHGYNENKLEAHSPLMNITQKRFLFFVKSKNQNSFFHIFWK